MNLWVRSQDKMNLVKIKQISLNYQNNKQIIANYIPEFYQNSGEYYEILGTYKTKKRALEVLDGIQGLFIKQKPLTTIVNKSGCQLVSAQPISVVYEMPEK